MKELLNKLIIKTIYRCKRKSLLLVISAVTAILMAGCSLNDDYNEGLGSKLQEANSTISEDVMVTETPAITPSPSSTTSITSEESTINTTETEEGILPPRVIIPQSTTPPTEKSKPETPKSAVTTKPYIQTTPKATEKPTSDTIKSHKTVDGFANLLSNEVKANYNEIVKGTDSYNSKIKIKISDNSKYTINNYIQYMFNYGFSSTGTSGQYSYSYSKKKDYTEYVITTEYSDFMNKTLYDKNKKALETKANDIVKRVNPNSSDYSKVKFIYDYLVNNTVYTTKGDYIYTPYGALIDGKAVCQGYALSFQLLANKLGVESVLVTGTIKDTNEYHMWNKVKIDGKWYNVDSTWGDPRGLDFAGYVAYSYLNITDNDLSTGRSFDKNPFINTPKATSTSHNYHVIENRIFNTSSLKGDVLIKKVGLRIKEDVENYKSNPSKSNKYSSIKLIGSNAKKEFNKLKNHYFSELEGGYSYIPDEKNNVITFVIP